MVLGGIVTGLISAVGGGLANVAITLASRRIGVLLVYVGAQLAAFATILLVAVVVGESIAPEGALPLTGLGIAFISTFTYIAFFGALRLGPVSVVSPVVGAYGGIAVVLALIFFDETISSVQGVAVVAAVAGVVMTSVSLDRQAMRLSLRGPGPALALAATVGFAANVTALAVIIREFGWLPSLVVWRFWMSLIALSILAIVLVWRRVREGRSVADTFAGIDRRLVGLILIAGMFDTIATVAIAVGLEISFAWLVGLLSSLGPMSGAVWGLILFRERLTRVQVAGIVLLATSLVILALA